MRAAVASEGFDLDRGFEQGVAEFAELPDLGRGEAVEDQLLDGLGVARGGVDDLGVAVVGEQAAHFREILVEVADADVAGARMTGAGFGGCGIALVKETAFDDFSKKIIEYYTGKIGYSPSVYRSLIGDGVGAMSEAQLS